MREKWTGHIRFCGFRWHVDQTGVCCDSVYERRGDTASKRKTLKRSLTQR